MRANKFRTTGLEIGRDYLLGRYIDEEDLVPEMRVYAMSKGARR